FSSVNSTVPTKEKWESFNQNFLPDRNIENIFLIFRLLITIFILPEKNKETHTKTILNLWLVASRRRPSESILHRQRMVVRLRLSRLGCKNKPFYRVMAADSRSPRDGKHLEVLGYYNPLPGQDGGKRMGINFDRVKTAKLLRNHLLVSRNQLPMWHDTRQISYGFNKYIFLAHFSEAPRYWLSVGAQPSEPVQRLLFRAGLLPPPPMLAMGRKGGPRDTRPVDPMTGRVMTEGKRYNAASKEEPEVDEVDTDDEGDKGSS
ncbi:30S ribosomal protein S16, partial [Striga asiatica]